MHGSDLSTEDGACFERVGTIAIVQYMQFFENRPFVLFFKYSFAVLVRAQRNQIGPVPFRCVNLELSYTESEVVTLE